MDSWLETLQTLEEYYDGGMGKASNLEHCVRWMKKMDFDDLGYKLPYNSYDLNRLNGGQLIGTWSLVCLWLRTNSKTYGYLMILELPSKDTQGMYWSTVIRHDRNHSVSETRGAHKLSLKCIWTNSHQIPKPRHVPKWREILWWKIWDVKLMQI